MESCRNEIRQINRNIRRLNCADAINEAQDILPDGRSAVVKDLPALKEIRDGLLALENAFKTGPRSEEFSDQTEEYDVPIVQTKQSKFLYEPDAVSDHVTLEQANTIAAEPF
ncbi:hypothetical protein OCA8868_02296 [Octadecabacter ascidiaceicola]|uniref:Uncharacterized protein n=2 Tax=Octadecabacter ascidiaceicola TaxID=1655543 RepID=A0A238KBC7_9RHOB|nr:hypothetical protein OCA8868_02296 [Octadecabacter ascidiaceicola]